MSPAQRDDDEQRAVDPSLADTDKDAARRDGAGIDAPATDPNSRRLAVPVQPAGFAPLSAREAAPAQADSARAGPESSYSAVPGALLAGKYRVVRTLGQGGGGVVLEAHHEKLDAPVAMKLLNPELVTQAGAVERFLREARAASRLTSVHVTRVLDVGTLASGEPFLVMEYLDGEDLATWSARLRASGEPPSVEDVLDVMTQACAGVADAHAVGVVHRDLKPANLFLTSRRRGGPSSVGPRGARDAGVVKVLDFGVSKVVTIPGADDSGLTTTTTVLGSVLYMSPEQMRSSKHVDHRTDIYALGACLYELVSGCPPHEAGSFAELCAKAYTEKPALLSRKRNDLPAGFDEAVDRALRHDPNERYASVAELVQALSPYASAATRVRMSAILEEHAPDLALLPRITAARRPARLVLANASADDEAASSGHAPPQTVDAPPRSPRAAEGAGPWLPRGALVSGAGVALLFAAASFFLWPVEGRGGRPGSSASPALSSTSVEPKSEASSPAAPSAAATSPGPHPSVAPEATASTSASAFAAASSSASAPLSSARPPERPAAGRTRSAPPLPELDAPALRTAPAGETIDSDLTETKCVQHLPSGDKIVPCPR